MPAPNSLAFDYDVFISYASEDRDDFVTPLFNALTGAGVKAWIDYGEIRLGDPLRQKIDDGLARSRFGVIVLSPHSIEKFWTNLEWDALLALEDVTRCKRILPVLHGLDHAALVRRSPLLGGRLSAASTSGVDAVAAKIVDAIRDTPAHPPRGSTRTYGLRRRAHLFVGRTRDLERVKSAILRGDTTVSAAISGLAGIGKTALATELAHQLAAEGHFPGGIFWLDAETGDLTRAWASDEIGGELVPTAPLEERVVQATRYLSRSRGAVLLVLDNVTAWTSKDRPQPLPQGNHVHLLMTTREAGLGGNDFQNVALDVLGPVDARELLLETAGRNIEPGVDELLEALEGHALAIELAGAFLREDDRSASEYLAAASFDALEQEASARVRYERTTLQALMVVWERLDDEGRKAWCTAAHFEPESVGLAISEAAGISPQARRTLRRYHLIQSGDGTGGETRWRMHRLVKAFGEHEARGVHRVTARAQFQAGLRTYAGGIDLSGGIRLYRPEQAHLDAEVARLLDEGWTTADGLFLDRVATGRHSAGELIRAVEVLKEVLAVRRRVLGDEHPDTLTSMLNLAHTLWAQGDLAGARGLEEQVLALRLRVLGEEHPDTLTAMGNLAETLRDQGDLAGARKLQEQVLEVCRRLFGEGHANTLIPMNNLASTLREQGDFGGACTLQKQVLEVFLIMYGEQHPKTLTSMNNLASILRDQGDLGGARRLEEQVLTLRRSVLGEEHPNTLISMSNLADTLQAQGDLSGARRLEEQVLALRQRVLGEEHPDTLASMNNLASTLYSQGDHGGARRLEEQVLEVVRRVLGEEHPRTLTSMQNLAKTLQAQGEQEAARRLFATALDHARRTLGPTVPIRAALEEVAEQLGL